jgi:hypothetical protein
MFLLSGCYSLDQNEFCPFGMKIEKETNYSKPIIVDARENKIPKKKQSDMILASRAFSSKVINDTYDISEYLCTGEQLPEDKYQRLFEIGKIYLDSGVAYPWRWQMGVLKKNVLQQGLEQNDSSHIITGTLCVIGLCTREEHNSFCKFKVRAYLKDQKMMNKLNDYYIASKGYKKTYPSTKSVSYCEGPKW